MKTKQATNKNEVFRRSSVMVHRKKIDGTKDQWVINVNQSTFSTEMIRASGTYAKGSK